MYMLLYCLSYITYLLKVSNITNNIEQDKLSFIQKSKVNTEPLMYNRERLLNFYLFMRQV